jgi:hypothetical protein
MACPFPGDLFAQFEKLQGLYLSYNNFTVRRSARLKAMGAVFEKELSHLAAGPLPLLQQLHGAWSGSRGLQAG